jgi:hypothetical protein
MPSSAIQVWKLCEYPSAMLLTLSKIVPQNASAFEGEVQLLGFLPFEEASTDTTLAAFLKYVKQVGGTPDQFSAYAWGATLAFRDAVNATVKANGVNGLTRPNLIAGIKTLTTFDAGGMTGTRSFKTGKTTNCFVMVQFKRGKWVRQVPVEERHVRPQGVERHLDPGEPPRRLTHAGRPALPDPAGAPRVAGRSARVSR